MTVLNSFIKGFKDYAIEGYNKKQLIIIYSIYKSGNLYIHPKTAYVLRQKDLINSEGDGSVSLSKAGIRLVKRILASKSEEYLEVPAEHYVTITEDCYNCLCKESAELWKIKRSEHH